MVEILTHLRDCLNPYFFMQQELNDVNKKECNLKFILVKTKELKEKE